MKGPDIPKTFSFGFLAMSLPPLHSTERLTHQRAHHKGCRGISEQGYAVVLSSNAGETDSGI